MRFKAKVLLISEERSIRSTAATYLQSKGYSTFESENGAKGLALVRTESPDLVLLDLKLPDWNGVDLLREIKIESEFAVVIMMTAIDSIEQAVKSLKSGADNFLLKPFESESMLILIEHAMQNSNLRRHELVAQFAKQAAGQRFFLSRSLRMSKPQELASLIAKDPLVTVLIQGEIGTGKRRWARWIHEHSDRGDK